jgi:DNA-binding PadR family transcriptional regulator
MTTKAAPLHARQRDILAALKGGGEMTSGELCVLFRDDEERTWRDFSTQGIYDALCKLERRGLVGRRRVMTNSSHASWAWSLALPEP